MPHLIPPVGEARDDFTIFSGLAKRLGAGDTFTEGLNAAGWLVRPYAECQEFAAKAGIEVPDLGTLKDRNCVKLAVALTAPNRTLFAPFRENPLAFPLGTPSGLIEIFSEKIDGFGYADCPEHPIWLSPSEWLGAATADTPLHLVSPQPSDKLHSQLESALADIEDARPETLTINLEDAAFQGISTRDILRVFNARGACRARAALSRDISPGVVALPTGAWYGNPGENTDPHGNPNVLTLAKGTSRLAQDCSAHSALVQVAKLPEGTS
ncbi:MAG: molybdopterin dinucleotide binding domain-containing protein [Pseudomonadota bacterium]